jgi:hypothetical protein
MTLGFTCRRLRPALVDLALGTLPMGDVPRVQAHVAGCAACRADLDAMRELSDAGAPDETPALPDDFWRRQRQAIMRRVRTASAPVPAPARGHRWQLVGALATVLLAVLVSRSVVRVRPPLPRVADHLDDEALLHLHDLLPSLAPATTIEDADSDVLSVHDLADDELDSLADLLDNAS